MEKRTYRGNCHCQRVQFECDAPSHLVAWDCNCSICVMKKNTHFVVPVQDFRLITGEDVLTTYSFNTHVAKHRFCNVCGVQVREDARS
jgi:hypothetical protein